jgi:hypothetical protein
MTMIELETMNDLRTNAPLIFDKLGHILKLFALQHLLQGGAP